MGQDDDVTEGAPGAGARAVEIKVPARLENLATLRAVVAAIATLEDLDLDSVSDLRLAVDEACTALIRSSLEGADLVLVVDSRDDALHINASTTSGTGSAIAPGSFGWHVMSSLVDEVLAESPRDGVDTAGVVGITLVTRRVSYLQ